MLVVPRRGDLAPSRLAALWSWSIDADTIFPLWVAIGTQRIAAFYAADLGHGAFLSSRSFGVHFGAMAVVDGNSLPGD